MEELLRRIRAEGLNPEAFLAPRRCMREPIPEIFAAANMLDRAVDAHLAGDLEAAGNLIRQADMPVIRAYTEMLWGGKKKNPDQWRYVRKRMVPGTPDKIPRPMRAKSRLPTLADRRLIIGRDGYNCLFCGVPVVRAEIRDAIDGAYPDVRIWGGTNETQHPAFQCMWLQYDHIFPHAKGGDNSPDNVVITCAPCNFGRGDLMLEEIGVIDPRDLPVHRTSWDGLERFLAR